MPAPRLGNTPLHALTTEDIAKWENGLPAQAGIGRRTARDIRCLLCTILGDAAAAKPPLIPHNPALRPRNRGCKTGRRLEREPQRVWATPVEALLAAERAALLTSRGEDFTMIVTIVYTGLSWAETIGLERAYLKPGQLHIEWQLHEIRSTFHRLPPKDDFYRSTAWERTLPAGRPPAVPSSLLTQQAQRHIQPCSCAAQHGGGRYLFPGPDGGPYRRSNYAPPRVPPGLRRLLPARPIKPAELVIADRHVDCPTATCTARHRRHTSRALHPPAAAASTSSPHRPQGRPPGPLGGLPARPRRHRPRSPVPLLDEPLTPFRPSASAEQDPATAVRTHGTTWHREAGRR